MHAGWTFLLLLDHGTPATPTDQLYPWVVYGGICRYEGNPVYYGATGSTPAQVGTVGQFGSMAISEADANEAITPAFDLAITPAATSEAVT